MVFRNYLAPIYDYTDLPFRLLCQKYGADAVCVPLVSAAAIRHDRKKISLVDAHKDEKNMGVQLVGSETEDMGIAASVITDELPFVSWLNINCGCPSTRTRECGGGSALLSTPEKIVEIVEKMDVDIPVSVKIRIYDDNERTVKLCEMIETAGADSIIVHGRTVKQGYSGKADWGIIKSLKDRLGIPVIGNGDITSAEQGNRLVADGFCDSYMIGRAAMSNPMVFSDKNLDGVEERFAILEEYAGLCEKYAEKTALKAVRSKAVNMLSGIRNAARIRDKAFRAETIEEILALKR